MFTEKLQDAIAETLILEEEIQQNATIFHYKACEANQNQKSELRHAQQKQQMHSRNCKQKL